MSKDIFNELRQRMAQDEDSADQLMRQWQMEGEKPTTVETIKTNIMNNDFMPEGYEVPTSAGNYAKFEKGDNKYRILSRPIMGWLDFKDKTPMRFRMDAKPEKPVDPEKKVKHFWSLIVWSYAQNRIQIMEITQAGLQKSLRELAINADWGAPWNYDITIHKKGEGMATEYALIPSPPKPVSAEILQAFKDKPITLDALYINGDPFAASATPTPFGNEVIF